MSWNDALTSFKSSRAASASARASAISRAASLRAFSTANGHQLWQVALRGLELPPQGRYLNRVQLRIVDGAPTVFGFETSGRYVEARDPSTGAPRGHAVGGEALWVRPFAELLYVELERRLRRRDHAADYVESLQYRYNLRSRETVADAVRKLDGTPLPGGRGTLRLSLEDDPAGPVVKARREAP